MTKLGSIDFAKLGSTDFVLWLNKFQ